MFEHDRRLAEWFDRNGPVISRAEATNLGLDHSAIARRLRAGTLVRVHAGVYSPAGLPSTPEIELRAALAAAGTAAWVSGQSLMRLYEVRGAWRPEPEITLLGSRYLNLAGVKVRRIDRIERGDVRCRQGLPALAPPLGLLTLGASVPARKVETAVHDMVFQGWTTKGHLLEALKRYGGPGRRGVAAFRSAVDSLGERGSATQTDLELRVLAAIRAEGLPKPHLQLRVVGGNGKTYRLDKAWPERLLNLEADGDRWHTSPHDQAEMPERDTALAAVGYRTVRVSSDDIEHRLAEVLANLRKFFVEKLAHGDCFPAKRAPAAS